MVWSPVGSSILVTTDWQYTSPVEGEYFRFLHSNTPGNALYQVTQASWNDDNTVNFVDNDALTLEADEALCDVVRLIRPGWMDANTRRIAVRQVIAQPTLESQLRSLLIPDIFQSQPESLFYAALPLRWGVTIQASDYVDPVSSSGGSSSITKQLTYSTDGDSNGLFYWLGANLGTTAWANPLTAGAIAIIASSLGNGTNPTNSLVDRQPSDFYTSNTASSTITFDLGAHSLVPNHYSIQSRNDATTQLLRNWQIRGSIDNSNWDVLDAQSNNANVTQASTWLSLPISNVNKSYRYLQLASTGVDSSNQNYITLGEIEFYGAFT